jgi:hypothetical protein
MSKKVKYELLLAAHRHVETMIPKADDVVNLMWYGWALRESFIAGAQWHEEHPVTLQVEQVDPCGSILILEVEHG